MNRDIADTRLSESVVRTTAAVKTAYWNLISARANVEARQKALDLAQELVRVNKARVDVGQSPPLDMVSAQAEARLERRAADRRADRHQRGGGSPAPADPRHHAARHVDASSSTRSTRRRSAFPRRTSTPRSPPLCAIAPIWRGRGRRSRTPGPTLKYAGNQRLPDVRVNAAYQANGLGGTQVLRSGGFPGTIVGSGDVTDFGSVLNQLFGRDYPTWTVGLSVSYPIGQSADDANYARARLETTQSQERLKSAEARVIQQVRDAGWKIEMNAKRIQTTRAARELAEQRLDAEQKRLDVGLSTSFLVIQAQRDFTQAKTNELSAVLAYDLALVDFDALQQAGPAAARHRRPPLPRSAQPRQYDQGRGPSSRAAAAGNRRDPPVRQQPATTERCIIPSPR